MAVSARTQRLKDSLEVLAVDPEEQWGTETLGCIERARYFTETFKQTEGQPWVIRRAKALANYLEKKTIYITEDELLVGHLGKTVRSFPFYMEIFPAEVLKPGEEGIGCLHPLALTADEWKELDEIMEYWKGKTLEEVCVAELPDEVKWVTYPPEDWRNVCSFWYRHSVDHPCPDLRMLFSIGLNGVKKRIEARLAELDPLKVPPVQMAETLKQRDALNSMLIAVNGVIKYVERYRKLATEMAKKEKDPARKAELEQIAQNCDIAKPVKSFWQAVQIIWFVHMIDRTYESMAGGVPDRLDQLLLPYYRHDIEAGRLTREKAQELLEDLWIKYERGMVNLHPWSSRMGAHGTSLLWQNITLGGVDEFGRDATNELTYLFLDTTKSIRTTQPTLSIRYHPGTPDELLVKAYEVIMTGIGMPAFFNDSTIIAHLLSRGVSLKDARNNLVMGCVASGIPARNTGIQVRVQSVISAAKCLELALNDGADMLDGKEVGTKTGDPRNFRTFEDVVEAFRKQVEYALEIGICASNITRLHHGELITRPFSSALNQNCIEWGKDGASCEDYDLPFVLFPGVIDVADSLAAIKKLIFDEKKITWDELLEALDAEFEGYEDIRQLCHDAPKFGEDDDYVDSITREVYSLINKEAMEKKDTKGRGHAVQYQGASLFETCGLNTAALPSGRNAREPLTDGGISPEIGFGGEPTKVMKSVSKVDHSAVERLLLNQRISPATTAREFVNFIRAWGELGVGHTQFNVFQTETLRDAQEHPEKYPDLLVRVAGYSAQFITLFRPTQDAIIARAEQDLSKC